MNVFSVIPGEAFRRKLVLVIFSIYTHGKIDLNMETKLHPKEVELFGTLPHPYRDHNRAAPEKPHKVTILHRNTNLVKYRLHIYHYSHWVLSEMKHYSNQTVHWSN